MTNPVAPSHITSPGFDASRLRAKVALRLGLPTVVLMLMSALDRVNVSFAALDMNRELGFSPGTYGLGAGMVFAGFLIGQFPSVLLLQRIGMRRWLLACTLLWGAGSAGLAFVSGAAGFIALRMLIGLGEAGLAPGIVLYLSQFATRRERASTFAVPMLAIPISLVIGSPLSGWLLKAFHDSTFGAWRIMLLFESLPTLLLGAWSFFYFPDHPQQARWLNGNEHAWLSRHAVLAVRGRQINDWSVLRAPSTWAAALLWLGLLSGAYGIMFWLPQMVQQLTGFGPVQVGFINALPWAGALLGTYFNSGHSDRTGERYWHVALPAFIAGGTLLLAWSLGARAPGLVALFVAGTALGSAQGAFWAVPAALLEPARLAVAVVAINICGSSGGLLIPRVIGLLREQGNNFLAPTVLIASLLVLSGVLALALRRSALPASAH